MDRNEVTSSVIKAIGYDIETNVLEVEFRTGRIYRYFMVLPDVYRALIGAESIGDYFNRRIRRRYEFLEVRDE